jgi:hypothetical protein
VKLKAMIANDWNKFTLIVSQVNPNSFATLFRPLGKCIAKARLNSGGIQGEL